MCPLGFEPERAHDRGGCGSGWAMNEGVARLKAVRRWLIWDPGGFRVDVRQPVSDTKFVTANAQLSGEFPLPRGTAAKQLRSVPDTAGRRQPSPPLD